MFNSQHAAVDLASRGATEYLRMDDSYSPQFHRQNQAIRQRAVHPDSPIPPPPESLTKFTKPPQELLGNVKSRLDKLREVADVKKGIHVLN